MTGRLLIAQTFSGGILDASSILINPRRAFAFGAAIVCGLFLLQYLHRRKPFILLWAAGWLLIAPAMLAVSGGYANASLGRVAVGFSQFLGVCTATLFLSSVDIFRQTRFVRPERLKALLVAGVWFLLAPLPFGASMVLVPGYVLSALILAIAGSLYVAVLLERRMIGAGLIAFVLFGLAVSNLSGAFTVARATGGEFLLELLTVNAVLYICGALGMHLLIFEDMTYELRVINRRLENAREDLLQAAITDQLTGCHNRRFLDQVTDRELQRHTRFGLPLSLLFVDVDRFKAVNDKLGHEAGDRVLQNVARFLKRHIREADYVFRYGGDEFLVLITCSGEEAERKGHQLKAAFEAAPEATDLPSGIGLSVGTIEVPAGTTDLTPLLREADKRMYKDKGTTARSARSEKKGSRRLGTMIAGLIAALALLRSSPLTAAAPSVQDPAAFFGFPVGADNKLARWDGVVDYMKLVASGSDRVRFRELGKTTGGQPFILLEIASPETLKSLDRFKELEHGLYFQNGEPSERERDEIFTRGKVVVVVTCSVHADEAGATQMSLELVHRLATEESPAIRKILDNVILLLVPSANPDGQMLVTDWFNGNLGTPYDASPLPYLYHRYAGHDLNRDMFMLTQKESQLVAHLVWRDWIPAIWLDQHQMGSGGARMFVMPAGDPINPNVHPLIYRWNGILGQSQGAALEASGRDGIIYGGLYSSFWQGAMAWSGWWHNQIGLLTEVAGVAIAGPIVQQRAAAAAGSTPDGLMPGGTILPPPIDVTPRTEYPRPWLGGRWTLRSIVDYELIATLGLLETAADRREAILRQIYEINRQTVEAGGRDGGGAIVIPAGSQHDPREAAHLVERLDMGGVEVYRAEAPFDLDGRRYGAGSFVVPMRQVFARYAKDLLEKQVYPDPERLRGTASSQPYDVTAWSLGMQLGVDVQFAAGVPPSASVLTRVKGRPNAAGEVIGNGATFGFAYRGPDTALAINRLLRSGARAAFDGPSHVRITGMERVGMEATARDLGLEVTAAEPSGDPQGRPPIAIRSPRVALYAPWAGGNIDEGWTRWVLEQHEFDVHTVHNADIRAGGLRRAFDAVILPDQAPAEILGGDNRPGVRPEYRGGIGTEGVDALKAFVAEGGTVIALGAATDLMIDRMRLPVRNLKPGLRRDQHFGPGTILRIEVDPSDPMASGVAPTTYGYYDNSPFFEANANAPDPGTRTLVVARYPNENILASGWLRGEESMAGRAAVVSVDLDGGRVVLFGLRPQHRAQTRATFPLLFNALYLSTAER